jgi:hypothetical protein
MNCITCGKELSQDEINRTIPIMNQTENLCTNCIEVIYEKYYI